MSTVKKNGLIIGIIILLVIFLGLNSYYRVAQGQEAVVLTFGKVTDVKTAGLYFKIPLIQNVIKESVTTIHTMEYGFRTTKTGTATSAARYEDVSKESVMLTNDNSIVAIEAVYQYSVSDVKEYFFDIDDPIGTLQLAFEAVIRRNVQNRPLDDALLNKEEIELEVLPEFQALVDSYNMGININNVRIQNISVPEAVAAAYEDVNNAKNEKTKLLDEAERYKNQVLPKARSEAYERVAQAEAYKAETIAFAEAEVAIFSAILEKYQQSPEVTRTRLMIETAEEILSKSGSVIVAEPDNNVVKVMNLNGENTTTTTNAAVLEGGK